MFKSRFVLVFLFPAYMMSQTIDTSWDKKLHILFWSDVMNTSTEGVFRTKAAHNFENLFQEYAQENAVIDIDFKNRIAFLSDEKQSWFIATWQWKDESNEWNYGGLYKSKTNQFIPLKFEKRNYMRLTYESIDQDSWYGAMYFYALPSEEYSEQLITFGFAQDGQGYKYKIIEVIQLNDTNIQFGKAIFSKEEKEKPIEKYNRIVIQYSEESGCSLSYDPDSKEILFDHIATITETVAANGKFLKVPDGTYEAYENKNGKWQYIERVPNQILSKPPRAKAEEAHENLDILGRKRE